MNSYGGWVRSCIALHQLYKTELETWESMCGIGSDASGSYFRFGYFPVRKKGKKWFKRESIGGCLLFRSNEWVISFAYTIFLLSSPIQKPIWVFKYHKLIGLVKGPNHYSLEVGRKVYATINLPNMLDGKWICYID